MFSQKTTKRILSLLLAVLMLASLCPLLSSCGEQIGVAKCSKKKLEIDLSGYSVVFESALSNTKSVSKEIAALSKHIGELTGTGVTSVADSTEASESAKEILIGNTSRAESQKATKSIKGDGFAILVSGSKIVITGSSAIHTLQALAFFSNQYLGQDANGKSITLHEQVKANRLERVLLADSERCYVTFVHPQDAAMDAVTGSSYTYGGRDCEGTVLENLTLQLQNITGLRKSDRNYPRIKDSEQAEGAEFLIGMVDRDFSRENLSLLQGDEYGIFVRNGSFALSAYSDIALWRACDMLENIIKDADGTVYLPEGFALIHPHDDWSESDFTKPAGEGISLQSTVYTNDHSMQYYYTGSGISAESYQSYCDTLKGEGYTVVSESSIEQSLFVTLKNVQKGHSLYVAYNAFSHRGEYEKTKDSALYNACIRVVVSPLDSVTLPDKGLLTPDPYYKKVTESAVTSGEVLGTAAGMLYIVTLEDGRFILFDGGGVNSGSTEYDNIYALLAARQEQNTGKPVSTSNPIHIAAWVITHSHWDHYEAFRNMLRKYGKSGKLKMDYLIGSYPAVTSAWRVANGDVNLMASESVIKEAQLAITGGFQFVKVHTGQRFYLANAEIEVLATFDDLHPHRITNQNDTNTVLRFTVRGTDGNGKTVGTPTTMLWLGDSYFYQSRYLCAMYGSYLQSDMVQIAHHGNIGCEKELYATVQASVLWFPIFVKHFDLFLTPEWTASYEVNHYTVNLPSTKYIYVSGNYDITLPFSAATGMPDYDAIYDTVSGTPIAYDNIAAFNSTERFR